MLGFGGVFGRKPRQFDYRPRYYDPEKEAREDRRKELLGEGSDEAREDGEYVPGQYLRNSMMARRGYAGHGNKKKRLSGPRAVLILIILALGVYWILFF